MAKYINVHAAADELSRALKLPLYKLVDAFAEIPAADVVPVVRGEWRWHEEWRESTSDGPAECQSAGYVCSACGIELSEYLSESLGEIIYADNPEETPKITFCPSCGAKMEEAK